MPRIDKPPTRDLDDTRFAAACRQLVELVDGFEPALVVGIATGGEVVAREMQPLMRVAPQLTSVGLQRPSTKLKERIGLGRIVGRLPTRATNALRWLEVELRELTLRSEPAGEHAAEVRHDDALPAAAEAADRILIVDDMVDSGRTLGAVLALVRRLNPHAEVRTAVLASSWRRPPLPADYCLYDRTLLRFPWSFDA